MEIETNEMLQASAEKLAAAASLLERMMERMEQREAEATGDVQKIVAEVDQEAAVTERELELERRLARAEQRIAELSAQESKGARKTLPATTAQLLAKQGITSLESMEAGALDAALTGLSLEQRIAVKSQLLRAGVVG